LSVLLDAGHVKKLYLSGHGQPVVSDHLRGLRGRLLRCAQEHAEIPENQWDNAEGGSMNDAYFFIGLAAVAMFALWDFVKDPKHTGDKYHDYRPKRTPTLPVEKNYEYIHDQCGKPAFYLSHRPMTGTLVQSSGVTLVNGDPAKFGQPIVCGSCGLQIHGLETRCVRKITL
jgi:hypothetical protein